MLNRLKHIQIISFIIHDRLRKVKSCKAGTSNMQSLLSAANKQAVAIKKNPRTLRENNPTDVESVKMTNQRSNSNGSSKVRHIHRTSHSVST